MLKGLEYNLKEDVETRVITFFTEAQECLRIHRAEKLLDLPKGVKMVIKELTDKLKPEIVQIKVKKALELEEKPDLQIMFQLVEQIAEAQQQFHVPLKKADVGKPEKPKGTSTPSVKSTQQDGKIPKPTPEKPTPTPYTCGKCGKNHSIKHCDKASDEEKRKFFEKVAENKKKKHPMVTRSQGGQEANVAEEENLKTIEGKREKQEKEEEEAFSLESNVTGGLYASIGSLQLSVKPDSGASANFIGQDVAKTISKEMGIMISPSTSSCRMADGSKVNIIGRLLITVNINSQKMALRVYVLESSTRLLLIGRPTLKNLGIDVQKLFEEAISTRKGHEEDEDQEDQESTASEEEIFISEELMPLSQRSIVSYKSVPIERLFPILSSSQITPIERAEILKLHETIPQMLEKYKEGAMDSPPLQANLKKMTGF